MKLKIFILISFLYLTVSMGASDRACSSFYNPEKGTMNRRILIDDFSSESFISQKLTNPKMIGKIVDVKFHVDVQGNPIEKPDIIPQKVHTVEETDNLTQELIYSLKTQSKLNGRFREMSGWVVYIKSGKGFRTWELGVGFDTGVSYMASKKALTTLFADMISLEGQHFQIDKIDFFHTHFKSGEPFNKGDIEAHDNFWYLVRDIFSGRGLSDPDTFTSYAVPIEGTTFYGYRSSYEN